MTLCFNIALLSIMNILIYLQSLETECINTVIQLAQLLCFQSLDNLKLFM